MPRGGYREGAGRKPTGRKHVSYYVTESEDKMMRAYLKELRSPNKSTDLACAEPHDAEGTQYRQIYVKELINKFPEFKDMIEGLNRTIAYTRSEKFLNDPHRQARLQKLNDILSDPNDDYWENELLEEQFENALKPTSED